MAQRRWHMSEWFKSGSFSTGAEINKIVSSFMRKNNIRYGQVAFGRGGVQWQASYQWTEEGSHHVNLHDKFMLASVSKAFVCAAITKLFPDEQARLNTMAYTVLGYQPNFAKDPRMNQINIQMLIDHTAGFDDVSTDPNHSPDWTYDAREIAGHIGRNVTTAQDQVDYVWQQHLNYNPYNDPNHQMSKYSNIGFIILSQIVAKKSNMSFYDYVHQNIARPLNLHLIKVPTQEGGYSAHADLIVPEAYWTGLPSYSYKDNTTQVNAVYGGDGMVKEACHGSCALACNASDLTNLIAKYAVWGVGPRAAGKWQRDGSTPGASAMICSSTTNSGVDFELAVVFNSRDSQPSGKQIDMDTDLYAPLINLITTSSTV